MNSEIWKPVVGYEGYYEVSDLGEVRSLDRIIKHSLGGKKNKRGCLMKQKTNRRGCKCIKLMKHGNYAHLLVHQLVAQSFIPNPENKPEVNHIHGIKSDNRASQLEWNTRLENNQHAFKTGLITVKTGDSHHFFGRTGLRCHNSKKVKSVITGEILNQASAAQKCSLHQSTFSLMMSGKKPNKTEYVRI